MTMPSVRIEGALKTIPPTDRVAIIASFGTTNRITRSLATLTQEFERGGYTVILVRASDDAAPLEWPDDIAANPIVVRKSNIGYDFGSWAVGLKLFPAIRRMPFVILANDSLVGPFSSLDPMLKHFETSLSDVWAATNTIQFQPHIQSYFVGYRNGILADPALRQFWTELVVEVEKEKIIHRYELGLSRLMFAEGITTSACFESVRISSPTANPTIGGWRTLLDLGFPFIKRELLSNPGSVTDAREIPAVIEARFGTDPREWF